MGKYLITGPGGSGKTSIQEELVNRGFQAFDADSIPHLAKKRDSKGRYVAYYPGRGSAWLQNTTFLWSKKRLTDFLDIHSDNDIFICGVAYNMEQFFPLFDEIYFLQVSASSLRKRLAHPKRKNWYGKDEDERENFIMTTELKKYLAFLDNSTVVTVDAEQPVSWIVDFILTHTGLINL